MRTRYECAKFQGRRCIETFLRLKRVRMTKCPPSFLVRNARLKVFSKRFIKFTALFIDDDFSDYIKIKTRKLS